jgi:hypothetical protein
MGSQFASEIVELDMTLERQLAIHFSSNCYPPIPRQMIPTAITAIDAYWEEEVEKELDLPEGVTFRGQTTVKAWQVINAYYLGAWCEEELDNY